MNRSERGARSYAAGLAAKDIAARWYQSSGAARQAKLI
jgi:hypothetical protein